MTIATTRTDESTIDEMVTNAYRQAGLLNERQAADTAKLAAGRRILGRYLQTLEGRGLFARTTVFQYVTCVAGTKTYSLDPSVLSVIGEAAYIPASEASYEYPSSESLVSYMTMEEWQATAPKDSTGTPTRYWVDRSSMALLLDPTPDEAGHLRLRVQQLRASCLDGNKTADVERFWSEHLHWKLAHDLALANSRNLGLVSYLKQLAESSYNDAADAARPREDNQFYPE